MTDDAKPRARPWNCPKCGRFKPKDGPCKARHLHGKVVGLDVAQLPLFPRTARVRVSFDELLIEVEGES